MKQQYDLDFSIKNEDDFPDMNKHSIILPLK